MEMLPKAPEWKFCEITIPGFVTEKPMILYYRDSFECLKMLMASPLLAGHIDFSPRKIYVNERGVLPERKYNEWMTSNGAWNMQASYNNHCLYYSSNRFTQKRLPSGGTLLGVVLSSDKTTVTSMTGDRVAHPLLLSVANIC